jgi:hypothetical protein
MNNVFIVLIMCMSFMSIIAQNDSNIVCTTTILCDPIYSCNGTCNNCTKCDGLYCISCTLLLPIQNISLNCGCTSPNICPTNPSPPDQNDYISITIVFSAFIFIFICVFCVCLFARRPIIIPVQERFHDHVGEPHYDTFHQIS